MNSLNLLSGRVSAPQSPGPSRSSSFGSIFSSATPTEVRKNSRDALFNEKSADLNLVKCNQISGESPSEEPLQVDKNETYKSSFRESRWLVIPKRISLVLIDSIRWIFSILAESGRNITANLYDEKGYFAPVSQIAKLSMIFYSGSRRASTSQVLGLTYSSDDILSLSNQDLEEKKVKKENMKVMKSGSSEFSLTFGTSEFESDPENLRSISSRRHRARVNSQQIDDGMADDGQSSCLMHKEKANLLHKNRKTKSAAARNDNQSLTATSRISPSSLKSPVSPASSIISRYTNAPAPPRPLIPRYLSSSSRNGSHGKSSQKTLILDLDETLIHSMAKGGRMNTGHMVEVRLNTIVAAGGNSTIELQHPILYWVNKRPHCDEFLRLVCKWYKLVVFTASVQEYADPVIDFLEQERKFFTGRYYRQHCTYRHGSFIKDLSSIEPDLSKVMILDNSPLSYMFHQENAIPIEGWINDPTDNDLLHLVPLLESLQYVTDVRAFLALRGGENGNYL